MTNVEPIGLDTCAATGSRDRAALPRAALPVIGRGFPAGSGRNRERRHCRRRSGPHGRRRCHRRRERSATVINIGHSKLGGPTAALHAPQVAHANGIGVMVGSVIEMGIATAMGLHLAAAMPSLAYPSYLMGPPPSICRRRRSRQRNRQGCHRRGGRGPRCQCRPPGEGRGSRPRRLRPRAGLAPSPGPPWRRVRPRSGGAQTVVRRGPGR